MVDLRIVEKVNMIKIHCVSLNDNAFQNHKHLKTWSPVRGDGWGDFGDVALMS